MNNHPQRRRGLLTSLAAAATAMLMAVSAAPAQADSSTSTIDASMNGTINIHKFEQPDALGDPSTGLPQDSTGTPLEGITFSAQRVGDVDLTTNDGWVRAGELTAAEAADLLAGDVHTGTTDVDGLASIASLPLGLYYVSETSYGADITPAAPFLVTLPMTHPTELNSWLYDVHVYPKNATTSASKAVQDSQAISIGDEIEWTILADIPKSQNLTFYAIDDVVDPKLQLVAGTVSLTGEPEVTLDEGDYVADFTGGIARIEFNDDGLAKLQQAWGNDATSQVKVVASTAVLAVGEIANTAKMYPSRASSGVATNQVLTKFGNIVLDKVDANTGEKLDNAQFQVFLNKADAQAKTNAISIKGDSVFTSDANGKVLISGLRYSNWENGEEVLKGAQNYRSYWIAETKAPGGYEMLAQPIEVDVTSFEETVSVEVTNVPKNAGFALPLTGASGASSIIMIAGVLLIVVGAAAVVVSRRKRARI